MASRQTMGWHIETAELTVRQVEISDGLFGQEVVHSIVTHAPSTPVEGPSLGTEQFWKGLFVPHAHLEYVAGQERTVLDLAVIRDTTPGTEPAGTYRLGFVDSGNVMQVYPEQDEAAVLEVYGAAVQLWRARADGAMPHLSPSLTFIESVETW